MTLPFYANLFAVENENPQVLEHLRRALRESEVFSEIWRPHPRWIVARQPLPEGTSQGEGIESPDLLFVEGRERIAAALKQGDRGQDFRDTVDHEPERLGRWPGDFGFLRILSPGHALLARSVGGLVPWYYGRVGTFFVATTRLEYLMQFLPQALPLDPLPHALWSMGWTGFPWQRTFFQGIRILPRGTFLKVIPGRSLEPVPYWEPPRFSVHFPNRRAREDHARTYRELLIQHLRRTLDPRGGNLLTLSGGVDSASLLALAAGVVKVPVMTWSLVPPLEEKALYQHEYRYIAPLRQRYKVRAFWEVPYPRGGLAELWLKGPRFVFHLIHPALCDLPRVHRETPVSVLFGGEFADNLAGQVFTLPDWSESLMPWHLLLLLPELKRRPRDLLLWLRYRIRLLRRRPVLPLPRHLLQRSPQGRPLNLFQPGVVAEYMEWYEEQRRRFYQDRSPWRYLNLESRISDGFVAMNWEGTSPLGIRRSFPFFNREILEFVFQVHPVELYGGGMKKILRRALHGLVPPQNLYRSDKGRWGRNPGFALLQTQRFPVLWKLSPELYGNLLQPSLLQSFNTALPYDAYRVVVRLALFQEALQRVRAGGPLFQVG